MDRQSIYTLIEKQCAVNDERWGTGGHEDQVWMYILQFEIGKISDFLLAVVTGQVEIPEKIFWDRLIELLVDVSAVPVHWIEDRLKAAPESAKERILQ